MADNLVANARIQKIRDDIVEGIRLFSPRGEEFEEQLVEKPVEPGLFQQHVVVVQLVSLGFV